MKTRNLIVRLNADELRQGLAWMENVNGREPDPRAGPIIKALHLVRDGGNLEGTAYAIDIDEEAPLPEPAPAEHAAKAKGGSATPA